MQREQLLSRLDAVKQWDILVIGGGASGLGIALEAASRGYNVSLLEGADFASGTSSKSTKLVHGGVRYLAQGDIGLVREAGAEREILLKMAPHLVHDTRFIIPIYNLWDRFKYSLGLKVYDLISGGLKWGNSSFMPQAKFRTKPGNLKINGLLGTVCYKDGQFDDARLALNLAQTINSLGALAINYLRIEELIKNVDGHLTGVVARDQITQERREIFSKVVINATGVFSNDILWMDDPEAAAVIRPSRGIHLVVPKRFFPGDEALMIPKTSDGRVLFAVPWHGRVVLGTTDTPVSKVEFNSPYSEEEIQFILNTAAEYLIDAPSRKDVLSVFSGLRPLSAPGSANEKTKEISRSHKIIRSGSGLLSMLGGKWTTYRRMGEDMINFMEKTLQWPRTGSVSANLKIHGFDKTQRREDPLYFYGADLATLKDQIDANPAGWLSQTIPLHEAQIHRAVEKEMCLTIEDLLARRCRALLLDAREAIRLAPQVANIMAAKMNKSEDWKKEQLEKFQSLANSYLLN